MAGAARLAVFHLRHCVPDALGATNENGAVTVVAFKKSHVNRMIEMAIKRFEIDIVDVFMALLAVSLYRKSSFSIMASATRLAPLHAQHCFMRPVRSGNKQLVMAIRTFIGKFQMKLVTEF